MKIFELSQEYGVTNKDMISYLKSQGLEAKSHMQTASDEMIKVAKEHFTTKDSVPMKKKEPVKKKATIEDIAPSRKRIDLDELIPCESIVPWKVVESSSDRNAVYRWNGFGDIEYVPYRDVLSWRRKPIIKEGLVMVDNPDICYEWRNEIGKMYSYFLNVEYPEEFFDLSDEDFKKLLDDAPDTIKEVIKYTAVNMIHNTNYPSLQKINIIDDVLNTCIKDFL